MLTVLAELPITNPAFYAELSAPRTQIAADPKRPREAKATSSTQIPSASSPLFVSIPEADEAAFADIPADDENIPTSDIIDHICSDGLIDHGFTEKDGVLITPSCEAESTDEDLGIMEDGDGDPDSDYEESGSHSLPILSSDSVRRSSRPRRPVDLHERHKIWEKP
jgi:hypothetical protein